MIGDSRPEARDGVPIAILAEGADLVLWYAAGDETIVRFACKSPEHAEELVKLCHQAFGMRTKESSFTTGLLHRDLEILCGL